MVKYSHYSYFSLGIMLCLLILCLNEHGTRSYKTLCSALCEYLVIIVSIIFTYYIGALHFVLKADDYGKGMHPVVITATDLLGRRANSIHSHVVW